jgi:hypothetical protein
MRSAGLAMHAIGSSAIRWNWAWSSQRTPADLLRPGVHGVGDPVAAACADLFVAHLVPFTHVVKQRDADGVPGVALGDGSTVTGRGPAAG